MWELGLKFMNPFWETSSDNWPNVKQTRLVFQVEKTALSIEPKLKVELCGSYRRGKTSCGDVDILITRPDNIFTDIVSCLTAQLKESGTVY
jgi:DNA polymerase lambda